MRGPLGDFLDKFKKLSENRELARNKVKESIEQTCGVSVPSENILIKDGVATIMGSASLKGAIFMKKDEILLRANAALDRKLTDIR